MEYKMKKTILFIIPLILFCFIGCQSKDDDFDSVPVSAPVHVSSPTVKKELSEEKIDSTVSKTYNSQYLTFCNKLFQDTFRNENYIFSPLSLYVALSMTSNGAKGDTLNEFGKLLCEGDFDKAKLNEYNKKIIENAKLLDSYNIADSIWERENVEKTFKDIVKKEYDTDVAPLTTAKHINQWVNEKTKGKITNIIDEVNIEDEAIIVNAIYFYGKWLDPIEKECIKKDVFFLENGKEVNVDFMLIPDYWTSVMAYKGGYVLSVVFKNNCKIFLFLPPQGEKLKDYVKKIDFKDINSLKSEDGEWIVKIPKYKISSNLDFSEILKTLGLVKCFYTDSCDLSGICKGVFISGVFQKATIDLNEKGVEATAATAIPAALGVPVHLPKDLTFNRPFAFMIYNSSNDTPVFFGSVYNPKE